MAERFDPSYFQRLQAGDGISLDTAIAETHTREFLHRHDGKLRRAYAEALRITKELGAPVIRLSSIPADVREERMAQFEAKAEEYSARILDKARKGDRSGLFDISSILHTLYKRDGLKLLLHFGALNTYAFSRALAQALNIERVTPSFESACGVIREYVKHGRIVDGIAGTDLPIVRLE